ncbi:MAG: thiamine-phosphate kinase [Bacteroidetes bacterium]|nr:thiamine-phosphate kinase [Bacteroidota bacterium]
MLEEQRSSLQSIETLGEFGLIDHLTSTFSHSLKSTIKGIGDDAAVIDFNNKHTVVSTDMLVEGIHFHLSYMPMKHLGYKSVVVNLSDICAMNATPTHITVSISVSSRFSVEALEEFYAGVALACNVYKVDLVGGDTVASQKGMTISVTALGEIEKNKAVYRSGAQENDLLVVSGDLGSAYLGFQVLERERHVFEANPQHQPDLDLYTYLVERQLKPEARKDIIELLGQLEVQPTAMIDISDGLASEIKHICKSSAVGCHLYEDKIPIDPVAIRTCEEFSLDPTTVALSGGEDYELLFTIAQKDYPKIKANPNLTVIGHITEKTQGAQLITRSGEALELKAQGWSAF